MILQMHKLFRYAFLVLVAISVLGFMASSIVMINKLTHEKVSSCTKTETETQALFLHGNVAFQSYETCVLKLSSN